MRLNVLSLFCQFFDFLSRLLTFHFSQLVPARLGSTQLDSPWLRLTQIYIIVLHYFWMESVAPERRIIVQILLNFFKNGCEKEIYVWVFLCYWKKSGSFLRKWNRYTIEIVMIAWQKAGNTSQMCFICDKTSRFKSIFNTYLYLL